MDPIKLKKNEIKNPFLINQFDKICQLIFLLFYECGYDKIGCGYQLKDNETDWWNDFTNNVIEL